MSVAGFRDAKVKAAMTKVIPGEWGLGSVSGRTLQHTKCAVAPRIASSVGPPAAWGMTHGKESVIWLLTTMQPWLNGAVPLLLDAGCRC